MFFPALVQLTDSRFLLYGTGGCPFSEKLYMAAMGSIPPSSYFVSLQLLYMTEELHVPLVKHAFTIGLAMNYALYVSVFIALLSAL